MNVVTYPTASDFLAATGDLLQIDEARFGLILGIVRHIEANPYFYGKEDPWFASVGDPPNINALVWRTPPFPVGFAWKNGNPEEAVRPLIEAISQRWTNLYGVTGHRELTDPFAKRWCEIFNTKIQSTMAQRIYCLTEVSKIPLASGRMRLATIRDKSLVTEWIQGFYVDIYGNIPDNLPNTAITNRIDADEVYIWEDGHQPVSMTLKGRPTEHGMAITTVYTPPEFQGHGYATSCVAAVCREILDNGYDFCTLYTDLSNPTSNAIYMKIGFRPVCDSVEYTFAGLTD